ncbi:hypothetical protein P7K49_008677 [Saguinus oedipus]|uniref:Uncharacterized protein n=1 Tax=Saguinus oedipus TaxID=9490 RepID=A0ABQ9VZ61_SAGOE|nr:hypothetical protein P7K49_008677 [Saguinus oedipus]
MDFFSLCAPSAECDKLRHDGYRSSQYYSQGPTFAANTSSLCDDYQDEDEETDQKLSHPGSSCPEPSSEAPGESSDGHHLQDDLQAMERQERGAEGPVCPQHQGLPKQEVDRQKGDAGCDGQASGQQPVSLCQVAPGAQVFWERKVLKKDSMCSLSSSEEERFISIRRPKTPTSNDFSDLNTQTNWTKSLPLPTPEEKMRQQAQTVQADVVPINITAFISI